MLFDAFCDLPEHLAIHVASLVIVSDSKIHVDDKLSLEAKKLLDSVAEHDLVQRVQTAIHPLWS